MKRKTMIGFLMFCLSIFSFAEDVKTDVLVVGGGGAGLTAAIAAYEAGAKVILIDKMLMLGGNTNYATAGMNAAGTKLQEKHGIKDSADQFYKDSFKGGKEKNDPELLKTLSEKSPSIVDWLEERGVDLSDLTITGGQSVKRTHRPKGGEKVGPAVVDGLATYAENKGIDIRTSTKAVSLIMGENAVRGMKVEHEGKEYNIYAKAVVMATGGFGFNSKMVVSYKPELEGFGSTNSPAITGDGIQMVEAAGGDVVDMTEIQTHPTVQHKGTIMITEAVRGDGAILVNREGKRFVNELETRDVVSKAELAQTGKSAFLIFDQGVREKVGAINSYIKGGLAKEANTLEELGALIGVDGKTLADTVTKYNAMVAASKDTDFKKEILARTLEKAPYYAIEVSPAVHHTMGGVKINKEAEVVAKNGKVIPGLYAAGEVTGGVHGANRLGGNAITDIAVFGKIAGENAAKFAK